MLPEGFVEMPPKRDRVATTVEPVVDASSSLPSKRQRKGRLSKSERKAARRPQGPQFWGEGMARNVRKCWPADVLGEFGALWRGLFTVRCVY